MSVERQIRSAPIAAQLRSNGCHRVDSLVEYAALTVAPAHLPHFYVVPESENASPSQMVGVIDQRVKARIGVVILVHAQARSGDAPGEALEQEIDVVRRALLGWTHPEASGPMAYEGGSLLSVDGRAIAWRVSFSCSYHLRKV